MNYDEKITYLGGEYSFHHIAALNYFPAHTNLIATQSLGTILKQVALGESNYGILAIDNTLAGWVADNLEK